MRVVWTKTAQKRLEEILIYIQEEFGDNAKQQFRSPENPSNVRPRMSHDNRICCTNAFLCKEREE